MLEPRYAIYARDGLTCLTFLAGLAAGIYFIGQKKPVIGLLTLAGIALLSLDPILQRGFIALQASDAFAGQGILTLTSANACLAGLIGLLGKGALLAAIVLALRPKKPAVEA